MTKTIIGIMGPGNGARTVEMESAYELGRFIANNGWILLTGGRNQGVMNAASQGAKEAGGLVVGILPDEKNIQTSKYIDIPIYTGMGSARNNINVLSSDVVISCGVGLGTVSEIALALKADKPVIMLHYTELIRELFSDLALQKVHFSSTPAEVIEIVEKFT